jgi:hypothetical protein
MGLRLITSAWRNFYAADDDGLLRGVATSATRREALAGNRIRALWSVTAGTISGT